MLIIDGRDPISRSDDEDELIFDHTSLLNKEVSFRELSQRFYQNGCKLQIARTISLCFSFFGLGLCFAIPTATLEDLKRSTGAGLDIRHIYTARYTGYLFGSLLGGFLFDRYNRQFLLFLSLLATSIGVIVMPFCSNVSSLMACTAITGITMGFLDTGGNVWCLDLWGRRSAPVMQTLHFFFGLGAFVAPLVAEPFLSPLYTNSSAVLANNSVGNFNTNHLSSIDFLHSGSSIKHLVSREVSATDLSYAKMEDFDNTFLRRVLVKRDDLAVSTEYENLENITSSPLNPVTQNFSFSSTTVAAMTKKPKKLKPQFADGNQLAHEDKWDRKSDKLLKIEKHTTTTTAASTTVSLTTQTTSTVATLQNATSTDFLNVLSLDNETLSNEEDNMTFSEIYNLTNSSVDASVSNHSSLTQLPAVGNILNVSGNVSKVTSDMNDLLLNETLHNVYTDKMQNESQENVSSTTDNENWNATGVDKFASPSVHSFVQTTLSPSVTTVGLNSTGFHKVDMSSTSSTNIFTENLHSKYSDYHTNGSEMEENITIYKESEPTITDENVTSSKLKNDDENKNTSPDILQAAKNNNVDNTIGTLVSEVTPTNETEKSINLQPMTTKEIINSYRKKPNLSNVSVLPHESESAVLPNSMDTLENVTEIQTSTIDPQKTSPVKETFMESETLVSSTKGQTTEGTTPGAINHAEKDREIIGINRVKNSNISPQDGENFSDIVDFTESKSHHLDALSDLFDALRKNRLGKFEIAYVILGLYVFVVSIVFLIFLCKNPREPRSRQLEELNKSRDTTQCFSFAMVGLLSVFLCLYVGIEVAVGEVLQTFTSKESLQLSTASGYFLSYLFWGGFAISRFFTILISMKFSGFCILLTNLTICLVASIMLVAGADKIEALLWLGTIILGLGVGPLFPTSIAWIERYVHVTNKTASVFVLGAAVGEIIIPIIINTFINHELMVLMYSNIIVNILCFVSFIVLSVLAFRHGEKYLKKPKRSLYHLANMEETEDATELITNSFSNSNGTEVGVKQRYRKMCT